MRRQGLVPVALMVPRSSTKDDKPGSMNWRIIWGKKAFYSRILTLKIGDQKQDVILEGSAASTGKGVHSASISSGSEQPRNCAPIFRCISSMKSVVWVLKRVAFSPGPSQMST